MKPGIHQIFPLLSIMSLSFSLIVFAMKKDEVKTIQDVTNRADRYSMILLKNLGYGGLIHNLKNYLIRRENSTYQKAKANVFELQKLNLIISEIDNPRIESNHKQLLDMIRHYETALEKIKANPQAEIKVIDDWIKYDDTQSINIIEDIRLARLSLKHRLKNLQEDTKYIIYGLMVLSILTLLFSFLINISHGKLKHNLKQIKRLHHRDSGEIKALKSSISTLTHRLFPKRFNKIKRGMIRCNYIGSELDVEVAKIATYIILEDRKKYVIKNDTLYLDKEYGEKVTLYLMTLFKKIKIPVSLSLPNNSDDNSINI